MRPSFCLRYLLPAGLVFGALGFACEGDPDGDPAPNEPARDGGSDVVDMDVVTDAACPDCTWFPEHCSRGAFCRVDVQIDPRTVLLALGTHDQELTAVGSHGAVIDFAADTWRSGTVGTKDALRAISIHGGELWAASSLDAVFVRPVGDGGTAWTHLSTRGDGYFAQNRPINGIFGDPQRAWAWAAITPVCAGGFFGDGVPLVRLRREPTRLAVEDVFRNEGFISKCAALNAVDGRGDAVWAAGDLGAIYKITDLEADKPTIAPENSATTQSLLSIWAEPSGHFWASGKAGTVVHRAPGQPFAAEDVPTTAALHAVRGTSASDVWVVGEGGVVLHFDGKAWSRVPVAGLGEQRHTLRAITAVAPDRVWIAGDGVLLTLSTTDEKTR